jgi:hypothetical protein
MNMFKAALLVGVGIGMTTPTDAQTFVRFHSGVNLSVAPGGSDRSDVPLATQQAENAQRVTEAAEIGFSFRAASRCAGSPGRTRAQLLIKNRR